MFTYFLGSDTDRISLVATHLVLVVLLLLVWRPLPKSQKSQRLGSVVSNPIGIKFAMVVPRMTIHRLTELDFGYVILSGCRP